MQRSALGGGEHQCHFVACKLAKVTPLHVHLPSLAVPPPLLGAKTLHISVILAKQYFYESNVTRS